MGVAATLATRRASSLNGLERTKDISCLLITISWVEARGAEYVSMVQTAAGVGFSNRLIDPDTGYNKITYDNSTCDACSRNRRCPLMESPSRRYHYLPGISHKSPIEKQI